MTWRNSPDRWGRIAQSMHWATALLILITFPIGWLANSLERGPTARTLFDVHFATGGMIFVLVVARLAWRIADAGPGEAAHVRPFLARVAKTAHLALYALMITALVSGYVIQIHMRPTLDLFGLARIPRPFEPGEDESLRAFAWYIHNYSVWALLGLASLHAGAALWHHFIARDRTLSRMLPARGAPAQRTGS